MPEDNDSKIKILCEEFDNWFVEKSGEYTVDPHLLSALVLARLVNIAEVHGSSPDLIDVMKHAINTKEMKPNSLYH